MSSCYDKNILVMVTDESDIRVLKDVLRGVPMPGSPSCGFSTDTSVTMAGGSRRVVFCVAADGCPVVRIGESDTYIELSDEEGTRMLEILMKYGMRFPCN